MLRIARSNLGTSFYHIIVQGINRKNILSKPEYIKEYKRYMAKYSKKTN